MENIKKLNHIQERTETLWSLIGGTSAISVGIIILIIWIILKLSPKNMVVTITKLIEQYKKNNEPGGSSIKGEQLQQV